MRPELIYVYDGSFDGFLTCVFDSFSAKSEGGAPTVTQIYKTGDVQLTIGAQIVEIAADSAKAERVYNGISQKLGAQALRHVYCATLSAEPDAETAALAFLRLAFKRGRKVSDDLADPRVWRMFEIARTIGREQERYIQFLRFSELEGGILFAEFEPEANVLPLILPHFSDRLTSLPFIIHDTRRLIAGVYDTKEWVLVSSSDMNLPRISDKENEYRDLWQLFFHSVAIKERKNLKLQSQFMPKKYWNHLLETHPKQ